MPTTTEAERQEVPLSYEQEQLWFSHQLVPHATLDHECVMVAFPAGNLDTESLRQSLDAFIQRHEIWRTTFQAHGAHGSGGPVQVVRPQGQFSWSVLDLSDRPGTEAEAEALRSAQAAAQQPFDLTRGPLVRALLVRLSADEHRLFLTLPRIISDWVSLTEVFRPELQALYGAATQRRPAGLPAVERQYADYAYWQRSRSGSEQTEHLKFWAEHLDGAPAILDVPADHRRPEQLEARGGVQPFAFDAELTAGLRALSDRQQVPLTATLTAAFSALMSRYTGQEDLLVGAVSERAPEPPGQPMVGCFLNTVVHRADLAGDPTVAGLLRRTQTATRDMLPHAGVPFDAVVKELRPERIPGCPPLVQVALAIAPAASTETITPAAPAPGPDWTLTRVGLDAPAPKFDLLVEVAERPGGLAGRFVYHRGLFEPETVRRMTGHWRMVLEAMVAGPGEPVSQLNLLTGPEREQLLRQWGVGGEQPAGPDVAELIGAQARTRPEATAVVCEDEQLSYAELDRRASQLARYLRRQGVERGTPVGVCLERSGQLVVALLAIFRAGGVYVPLDPAAPAERIRYVVRDTGMPLMLTQAPLRETVEESGTQLIYLADAEAAAQAEPGPEQGAKAPPLPSVEGRQAAYIIYTSGSTGQPKGVVVERAALSAHCRTIVEEWGLTPQDRVTQFSQYSFDASLEQILPPLAAGGRLVMRGAEIWSSRGLMGLLRSQRVTVMILPAAYWQQVVREWTQTPDALAGTQLRLVVVGGEQMGRLAVQQWSRLGHPGTRLINVYGPTEATITATMTEIRPDDEWIPIGRPLPGRAAYILDRQGQPAPAGVVGELYVGGGLLARGYLNRPELTEQRFVPDPFSGQPGARLYRTGDRARFLADSRIEYMGREDQQVKIRGYRIELGEVEAALAQYPGVAQAAVVARKTSSGPELAGFVVAKPEMELDQPGLRPFLRERLPAYMVPPVIEALAEMPWLASGKPDRRRLMDRPRDPARTDEGYVAPRLPIHEQLLKIWEELLDTRPIGITDNFFDIGGHSLLAAQLVDRIDQRYGTKLTLSALFGRPTIEQLAEELQAAGQPGRGRVPKVKLHLVQRGGTRTPFFFLHGDWTGGAFYCYTLAQACGDDQPFYALEPYVFSDQGPVPAMEEIAAAHLDAIRAVQPQGPYRLGGFCNGGLLAYEMARQLEQRGEEVEFLGLVNPSDPFQPGLRQQVSDRLSRILRLPSAKQMTGYLRTRQALRHVYRRLRPAGSRVEDFGKLLVIEPRLAAMFPPRAALYRDYVGVFAWLAGFYQTGRYRGPITFYWARELLMVGTQAWRPLLGPGGPVHHDRTIEGALMTSVTEHIDGLARQLSQDLDQVSQDITPATASAAGPG
ncbi:MAG TPA: amino acid adenylation domain-containing protein [Streptosporangiaceae bacterium]|nr:amino acid adenylation domain-containing protein [Streptosporangiaceae bacterium]